ncbi:MAG: outer membrane lipoprotein-sorting protein [Spirochaetes bacterium]|nr:outer membrane lipoprotein-sorting protein [Spirochaetota bacterium]
MTQKSIIISFITIVAFSGVEAAAMTAKEIVEKSEKAMRGNSQVAVCEMTIKTRRWTRTLKVKNWENRIIRKSFTEVLAPKADAGNRFLMVNRDRLMWQYNPRVGKEIKIHPSMMLQSWMGSDFTNDDIVKESSMIEDYHHTLAGTKTVDGHRCHWITMKPKQGAAVVWGSLVSYARTADCLPVRLEYYDQHGKLKKVLSFSNFREMGGRVIPVTYRMTTMKKRRESDDGDVEEYTLMEIRNASFDIPIDDSVFTIQNLKRR